METKKISFKKKKNFDFICFSQSYGYQATMLEASVIESALQLCDMEVLISIVGPNLLAFTLDQEIVFTGNERRYRGTRFKIENHKKLYAIDFPQKIKGVYLSSLATVSTKKTFNLCDYSPKYEHVIEDVIERQNR